MAIAEHAPAAATPLPAQLGSCHYCTGPLYENAPLVRFPDQTMAHVACEINARRQGRGRG